MVCCDTCFVPCVSSGDSIDGFIVSIPCTLNVMAGVCRWYLGDLLRVCVHGILLNGRGYESSCFFCERPEIVLIFFFPFGFSAASQSTYIS